MAVSEDEYVRSYLEMTSQDQLVPGRPAAGLRLEPADGDPGLRDVVLRVGAPYGWPSQRASDAAWAREMADPAVRYWYVTVDGAVAGVLAVQTRPGGEAEILTFGLLPEFVGRGYGGAALTEAIRTAWSVQTQEAEPIRRVWLHTSTMDHPNALRNYESRGFRVTRTETVPKLIVPAG